MKWNGGMEKWNSECTHLQLTCVTGTVPVELTTIFLGFLSHHEKVQCCQHTFLHNDVTVRKWGSPKTGPLTWAYPLLVSSQLLTTVACMGPHLLLLRKTVVKASNNWEPSCIDEDQSEEIKDQALILPPHFGPQWHFITPVLATSQTLALHVRIWLGRLP